MNKLTPIEKAKKEALDQIYDSSKYSVPAFLAILFIVYFLIHSYIATPVLYTGVALHILTLLARLFLFYKYSQIKQKIYTSKTLHYWTYAFMSNVFVMGLLWGSIFFVMHDAPKEYYYIIYGINVGLVSAGLLSLGILPRIFLSFLIPLLSLSIAWMLLQTTSTDFITIISTLLGLIYYLLFLRKNAQTFLQNLIDKATIKENFQELKKIEKKNNILRERTELALQGSGTSVLDWNFAENSFYISPSWKEMLGYEENELDNSYATWKNRVHKEDLHRVLKTLIESQKKKEKYFETLHRLRHKEGHYLWILGKSQQTFSKDGTLIRMIGTHIDITKEQMIHKDLLKERKKLHFQAHHDALTGLANRVLFFDRLKQSIKKAQRSDKTLALLYLDLDHFKEINDSLGHDAGDTVLLEVTKFLQKSVRSIDTIARLGGDEFAIIIDDLNDKIDVVSLAEKIIENVTQAIYIDHRPLYISSSIGVSFFPDDSDDCNNLLKYADSAMYKAKAEGRNNFQFYSAEMTEHAFEHIIMETNLREAIKNEELVVFYQAQVNAENETVIGAEALVRWEHPQLGIISPAKFLPVAESTGLIVEIDRYVMKTAMSQVASWYKKALFQGSISMNLTMRQLKSVDFISFFEALIQETQCHPSQLELEVTEGQVMANPTETITILNQLSDMGIKLAIDDFGTGYSSLSYLKKLPISKLKIDQSFVRDLPNDEEDAAITKAVIALAKSLKLKIIAEGVETLEQKDFMLTHGCKTIQGYFYAKPLPASEFEIFLKNMTK